MSHSTTIIAESGLPFVDTVREFAAPVAAVFRAHTDPALLTQWMGPRSVAIDFVEYEAATGGRYRFEFEANGHTFSFHGIFHTVEPDALLVQTFEFSGAPGQVGIGTSNFTEVDGRTRLSIHEVYPTVEARDAAMASGMASGVIEGYERLDELLAR